MTTRNFTSAVAKAEGWAISRRDASNGTVPFTLVTLDGKPRREIARQIVEAAEAGSIEHRAALTFLHVNEPAALAEIALLADRDSLDGNLLTRICKWRAGTVHPSSEVGMTVMLFDRSEYVRPVDMDKWDVVPMPQHHAQSTRIALFEGAQNFERYAGLRDGKMVLFDPHTGALEQPALVDFRSYSILDSDGRLFAPLWAAPSEILAKATASDDAFLQKFVHDSVAAFPVDLHPEYATSARGYSQGEVFAVDVVTGAAKDILSIEDLHLAIGRYRAAYVSSAVSPVLQTKEMLDSIGREALARRQPGLAMPADDDDDDSYDDTEEFETEVLAAARPVLELPSFQDPHFRAQARQWLTPSMGEGFPLEDMITIHEYSEDTPVIDALMEAMTNEDALSYPGVSHGRYETSEMTSLEANGYRAVVFSDFMGRYAYVLPSEGLAPRLQPNPAPAPSF